MSEGAGVQLTGPAVERSEQLLTDEALAFLADLHRRFDARRRDLLAARERRYAELAAGGMLLNLRDALRRTIDFTSRDGKTYALADEVATIVVRPRGWHLPEKHVLVDGKPMSGSLVDFGLYLFHCAQLQLDNGRGPYFYLPKMESHLEARLWNDVFGHAQDALGLPQGTIRATVLIETYPAAFEMDEILYELREHSAGLNAGCWDYMFSVIKKFRTRGRDFLLPDRNSVTMTVPFDAVLGDRPNQLHRLREDVHVTAEQLLDVKSTPGQVTEAGLRNDISVGIQYLAAWLRGNGAVGIFNLMEDAATAEIARSQVWQWLHNDVELDTGQRITRELVEHMADEEIAKLPGDAADYADARATFIEVAVADDFAEFLTLPAYERMP